MRVWLILGLVACSGAPVQKPVTPAPPVPVDAPEDVDPLPAPGIMPTPQKLYEMCEDRVELPQVEGECSKDEDCATSGCSKEVCTTSTGAADVVTTCEGKLCFAILDTCGCVEGQCSWSIKDAVPDMATPIKAPGASLPVGGPKGE